MARISYKAEYEALKAAYEGMPTKIQFAEFRTAYSEHTGEEAKHTKLTAEQTRGVQAWARLAADSAEAMLKNVAENNFGAFRANAEMAAEYSHIAYRGEYGRNEDWTMRRQKAARKVLYMSDEAFAKVEAIIAEEQAKKDARLEALKEKSEA